MSRATVHDLKVLPEFFEALMSGDKPFEVRRDDRGFRVGDRLTLREWDRRDGFTGRKVVRDVTYILAGPAFGIEREYIVMGLSR